ADDIGLSFFVVMGGQKALEHGPTALIAIGMGTITGAFGGVIRDIMANEMPLVLRGELYATAAFAGGIVYTQCLAFGVDMHTSMFAGMIVILLCRLAAIKWNLHFPVFRS
ncbi:MAG: TRIC cation channel family protein, partial [Psychrosphaera sp.]|nr:TRIC cation channel family protein [Psychrosphaera sp.]